MLGLMAVHRALGKPKPLRYAPVRCTAHQCFIDTVSLGVITHSASSGHRASLLPVSRTHYCHSYLPRARPFSFSSHSLTHFSYQIGPIASWRLGRGMRRKFLLER